MASNCKYISVHPDNPQIRLLEQAVDILRKGGVIAYPTESGYALGCLLDIKDGADRIRQIRQLDEKHELTLMCRDLSNLSEYAKVGNTQFRYLKSHLPGPYTFILPASREVPKRLQAPKRKTIGLRVTPNIVTNTLLSYFDKPLLTATLIQQGESQPMTDGWTIQEEYSHCLDAVLDGGFSGFEPTTIIDFTEEEPVLVRKGQGEFIE
ncbi:L-threonylcarbamoyladenylate synthase [Thiomicrorhabdus lithotrophica]|uniref:L-threonylcarbamoyladenylate synthase n=1 Tax=Thiomicrorhabdus lithotrophica TaxID=2949997 RepID=A0ABY8CGZ0_9GAMM|nr:L-threonylcarbamoyladenylate synthase [Thiomicrorhabdus lithotrophica]WEJ63751.1 L-threonylcarbamoyladenylate synthase [Thiomicrorhabdus lithotrophica]